MSNEAQQLLNEIQFRTGKTLEEIASDIGYSRPYLNNVKLKGGGAKIIGILKSKYEKVLQNVLGGTSGNQDIGLSKPIGYVPASEMIEMLKQQNEFLRRNFEASLTGILVQGASILAHVATSLEKDDERDSQGDAKKLQQLKKETGRRIGEKLTVHGRKDMKIAGK